MSKFESLLNQSGNNINSVAQLVNLSHRLRDEMSPTDGNNWLRRLAVSLALASKAVQIVQEVIANNSPQYDDNPNQQQPDSDISSSELLGEITSDPASNPEALGY